jgi:hypothetical protein
VLKFNFIIILFDVSSITGSENPENSGVIFTEMIFLAIGGFKIIDLNNGFPELNFGVICCPK